MTLHALGIMALRIKTSATIPGMRNHEPWWGMILWFQEFLVTGYKIVDGLDAFSRGQPILRGIQAIIHEPVDGGFSHVHPRVAWCIIDEDLSILIGYPAVCEEHVHHVAHVFLTLRGHEIAAGGGNLLPGFFKRGHVHIEHVAEPVGRAAHAMGKMKPSFGCLDRMRALAVLHLFNRMIDSLVDDALLAEYSIRDIVYESPTDSTAVSGVDESVLRTGI